MKIDKRFSKIAKDARFKTIPKRERKVRIDSRFKSMFTDRKFKTNYYVDKRGRPEMKSSKEDLKRFYDIEENELEDKSQKEEAKELASRGDNKDNHDHTTDLQEDKGKPFKEVLESIEDDESDSDENIDFSDIRGGAECSSSDEEDSQDEDEGITHHWGELDHDAPRKDDNAVTSRLAACNLDWDRVNANDLLVLFSSFSGTVKTVKIYLSEFGKKRLAEEDLIGPTELQNDEEDEDEEETNDVGDPNNLEGTQFHLEKLRKYQLNRLKYYYAIIECDTQETANKIYEECDGMEYELSATRLDLRFVPDDTDFEDEPKDVATERPLLETYQPKQSCNTALQQSTVRCTWDEPDPKRIAITMRKFNKDEILDMDFKAYLASDDDDDDDHVDRYQSMNGTSAGEKYQCNMNEPESEDMKINKYRALLQEIESQEKVEDDDQHMEISWTTGLSEKAEKIVKNKIEQEEEKSMTPWEKYLKERKRKKRDKDKVDVRKDESGTENTDQQAGSEHSNDIDKGFDDPFFTDGMEENNMSEHEKKKKKKTRRNKEEVKNDDIKEKSELELLLMDDKEDKQHFNLKSIMAKEKRKNKLRKKDKKKSEENPEDDFEIDVKDSRFDALFTSHVYAPDPSDPQFKKTKAMDRILEEQQRRRKEASNASKSESSNKNTHGKNLDSSLSALVKTVKSRTEQLKNRKKPKLS